MLLAAFAVCMVSVSCTPTTTPASTTTSEATNSTTSTSSLAAPGATDYVFFNDLAGLVSGNAGVVYSSVFDAGAFNDFALQSVISTILPACGFEPCINTDLRFSVEFSVDGTRWNDLGTNTTVHFQGQLAKTTAGPIYARYLRVRASLTAIGPQSQVINDYEYPGTVFVAARFTN
jgi:hypothetical protein